MVARNFKENPVTTEELRDCYWYAVVDDLIGGWNISNVNAPASELNVHDGEFEVGSFMQKETAEHIAELHNRWWTTKVAYSYFDNLGEDWMTYSLTWSTPSSML